MKIITSVIICVLVLVFLLLFSSRVHSDELGEYADRRRKMVASQIKDRGISDPGVLSAMAAVPRHGFVPDSEKKNAYQDRPLPIGYGQTISQPYIVALMTQLLRLNKTSRVLEVGTGSGYQAAVLAHVAGEVYTVEIVKPLHDRSQACLKDLGYGRIKTLNADGYFGWDAHAPFDAVIVTCASDFIPPPLIQQLAEGGRMCIPVGPPFKVQHLVLVKKEAAGISSEVIASVRFVPLLRAGE